MAKSLVIVFSYHHGNTEKVAEAITKVLNAELRTPSRVDPEELAEYDLVGFGSGIDSDRHYQPLLDLADALPPAAGKPAFVFSTCGIPESLFGRKYVAEYRGSSHSLLRGKLLSTGYAIIGEFNCPGFNTNGFLRYFGGLNRGRPNREDIRRAEEFAEGLVQLAFDGRLPVR
jgi:flavodoxin